jgi:hypothetical protein
MDTQVLEGTLAEIRQKLGELSFAPDERLRVVISPAQDPGVEPGEGSFRPTEFRNGVPLLPRRPVKQPINLALVKQLLDEEDIELLRADRTPGH